MSDEPRRGGLGAAFVLLVFVGVIAKFWLWIVAVLGVLAIGAALIVLFARVERHVRVRRAVQAAIAARADEQHAQIMAGDARGIYGAYPPAVPPAAPLVAERAPHLMSLLPTSGLVAERVPRPGENWAGYLAETRRKALAGDGRGCYGDYRPQVYPTG